MSISHKGSLLQLSNVVLPVDRNTSFLAHYDITENDVLNGIPPIQNTTTLRSKEGIFGGGIAIEEGTTNTWGTSYTAYNNYGVPVTKTQLSETYLGQPIYRFGFTVDDAHSTNLSHFQTSLTSHGVYGGSQSWVQDTSYVSSIYWRPVNKLDMVFGGTASNTTGWSSGGNEILVDGWRRFHRYRTGVGVATKTDNVHHSFYCPSLQLNETVYFDVACAQTEQGRVFPTSYVEGSRSAGILSYDSSFINPKEGTISFWYKPLYPSTYVTSQTTSPKLIQIGNYYSNSSLSIWNLNNSLNVYTKGITTTGWSGTSSSGAVLSQNTWTMVSVTWKSTAVNVYVNGVRTTGFTMSEELGPFGGSTLFVGGEGGDGGSSGGKVANGIIDELRIDSVERTAEEIFSWYISGNPFSPKGIYRIAY